MAPQPQSDRIGLIEELAANAWPPSMVQHVDGWRLRFTHGVTRRANSVLPVAHGRGLQLDEKVQLAEESYSNHGLPARYLISPVAQPHGLDDVLARRGYELEAPTLVQSTSIERVLGQQRNAQVDAAEVTERLAQEWLATYNSAEGLSPAVASTRDEIVSRIPPPTGHATVRVDERPVAVGLGVVERGWVGIYDMATALDFRRKGYATAIVQALAEWGRGHGAERLYLGVMEVNAPARSVYDRLGFTTLYAYHYRARS